VVKIPQFWYQNYLNWLINYMDRVLLQKLIGVQPVMKFNTYYGTQRFIIVFTTVHHHTSLSCV